MCFVKNSLFFLHSGRLKYLQNCFSGILNMNDVGYVKLSNNSKNILR